MMPSVQSEVIVAGHICLDVIPQFYNQGQALEQILVPGKLVNIGPSLMATGGAVSNTGLALQQLGIQARLMGKVGDDQFGNAIMDVLNERDPALTEHMIKSPGENSSYSLVISPPGVDRIFLHCTGANDTFSAEDIRSDDLKGAKLFHFGYPPLMKNMFTADGSELENLFSRVKQQGLTTSLDMALPDPHSEAGQVDWQKILQKVLPHVDIFLPSFEEILYMLERDTYDTLKNEGIDLIESVNSEILRRLSSRLLDMGAAIVVIKLGERGLYVRTTENEQRLKRLGAVQPNQLSLWQARELWCPCFQVEVAGTTGAGDCTIAGFLAGFLKNQEPEQVLKSAAAVGACNVECADATSGIPDWDHVQERIQQEWACLASEKEEDQGRWDQDRGLWYGSLDHNQER